MQIVKRYSGRCVTAVERRLRHGSQQAAEELVALTQVGIGVFNTAYIEWLNATFRTWIPATTRKTRTPAARCRDDAALFWTGVVYPFLSCPCLFLGNTRYGRWLDRFRLVYRPDFTLSASP